MDHYKADALILWCVDDRFSGLLEDFKTLKGFKRVDLIKIAGGAKNLAEAEKPENSFALGQIKKLIELHHAPIVALVNHSQCGAYGKKFESRESEIEFHKNELGKARVLIESAVTGGVDIETYFADQDGLLAI